MFLLLKSPSLWHFIRQPKYTKRWHEVLTGGYEVLGGGQGSSSDKRMQNVLQWKGQELRKVHRSERLFVSRGDGI